MSWLSQWQWKWIKFKNWAQDHMENTAQLWKGVKVQHKMCPECRALVDKSAAACPLCGASMTGVPSGGLTRFIGALFPKAGFCTATILAINLLLYIAMAMVSARVEGGATNILLGADIKTLVNFGADMGYLVQQGQIWRWVTAIFLHSGILHIAFNSMALYSIGPQMEEIYGRSKFIFLYLMTGVAGNVASFYWLHPLTPSVGASGAIFGLIGVMAVYGHRRGGSLGQAIKRGMIQWAIYGLLFGFFVARANNAAHIGGLIMGCILSFVVNERPHGDRSTGVWGVLEGLSVLIIVASFMLNFINYGTGIKYLSPFF